MTGKTRSQRRGNESDSEGINHEKGTDKRKQGRFGISSFLRDKTMSAGEGVKQAEGKIADARDDQFMAKFVGPKAANLFWANRQGPTRLNESIRDPGVPAGTEAQFGHLRPGERSAIAAYTGQQYLLMNPALAGNKDWMRSAMTKINNESNLRHDTSEQGVNEAIDFNKEIGQYAISSINKLPNWEQGNRVIYRGETFTEEEGLKLLKPGYQKTYPNLVSTSLSRETPERMLKEHKKAERPYGFIFHILSSQTGKDIAPLSNHEDELEILFPANTTFTMGQVLGRDDQAKNYEVEVSQS